MVGLFHPFLSWLNSGCSSDTGLSGNCYQMCAPFLPKECTPPGSCAARGPLWLDGSRRQMADEWHRSWVPPTRQATYALGRHTVTVGVCPEQQGVLGPGQRLQGHVPVGVGWHNFGPHSWFVLTLRQVTLIFKPPGFYASHSIIRTPSLSPYPPASGPTKSLPARNPPRPFPVPSGTPSSVPPHSRVFLWLEWPIGSCQTVAHICLQLWQTKLGAVADSHCGTSQESA